MAAGQPRTSFRPRSAYLGHLTVDDGDGAVLIEPEVVSELRAAAARAGHGPVGGLLYGHSWHDEAGGYTVVDAFTQAGPAADLHHPESVGELRSAAAQRYPHSAEVGWWRSAPPPVSGAPAAQDPGTWPLDQRPDGVGLVVYADGAPWEPSGPHGFGRDRPLPGAQPGPPPGPAPLDPAPEPATPEQAAPEQAGRKQAARELISPLRTAGPPALSPDPSQMWRPKPGRRRTQEAAPWWHEAHRVVGALIVVVAVIIAIAVFTILSPLF